MTKYSVVIGLILFFGVFTSSFSLQTQASGIKPNDAVQLGDMISLNITGNEFEENLGARNPKIFVGDNKISNVWDDALFYPIPTYGAEHGQIASIHGATDIYFLLTHDIADFTWIAMQWDTDRNSLPEDMEPMDFGDDMWVFGETEDVVILGDGNSHGTEDVFITSDVIDDLFWEKILVNDTDGNPLYVAWEVKRALNTGDELGKDVVFDQPVNLMVASNVNHKQDNSVLNFSLSAERLGGEVPIPTQIQQTKADVSGFFFKQISLGLLISSAAYIVVFFPTLYILKKEKKEG